MKRKTRFLNLRAPPSYLQTITQNLHTNISNSDVKEIFSLSTVNILKLGCVFYFF